MKDTGAPSGDVSLFCGEGGGSDHRFSLEFVSIPAWFFCLLSEGWARRVVDGSAVGVGRIVGDRGAQGAAVLTWKCFEHDSFAGLFSRAALRRDPECVSVAAGDNVSVASSDVRFDRGLAQPAQGSSVGVTVAISSAARDHSVFGAHKSEESP